MPEPAIGASPKRSKNQAVITVALSCEIPQERMNEAPSWQGDASDILRETILAYQQIAQHERDAGREPRTLATYLRGLGISVAAEVYGVTK